MRSLYILALLAGLVACGGGDPEDQEREHPIPNVCQQEPRPQQCL